MAYDWCTDNSTTDIGPIISRVVKLGKPYLGYLSYIFYNIHRTAKIKSNLVYDSITIYRLRLKSCQYYGVQQFIIKYLCTIDYLNCFNNLTSLVVFLTSFLKFLNYFLYFSLRNGELNVKNYTFSRRKNFVFLFFIWECMS